jgi:hypothetical protein
MKLTQTIGRACIAFVAVGALASLPSAAQDDPEGFKIGFFGGASVPQAGVDNVFQKLKSDGVIQSYDAAKSSGLHFGAKVRLGIGDNFSLQGTASINQFANQQQSLSIGGVQIPSVLTSSSHVPVTAGITWLPVRSFVMLGVSAELVFSYRSVGLAADQRDLLDDFDIDMNNFEYSRSGLGAALGVMAAIDIAGLQPYFEVKNIWSNQFIQQQGDPQTSFMQISLGLML